MNPTRRHFLGASVLLGLGVPLASASPATAAPQTTGVGAALADATTANARTGVRLRHQVDRRHPLYLSGYYGVDTVQQMWSAIPDGLTANTAVLVIPGNRISNDIPSVKQMISEQVAACDRLSIPIVVQALNGETHVSEQIPVSFWADLADEYSSLIGLNAAELYNSIWNFGYGQVDGDHSEHLANLINLCGQTGMRFVWTDTNMRRWSDDNFAYPNPPGTITDWLEDNEHLLAAMKANHENVVLMNKESIGDADTDALFFGLWLAGYADNWGSSADWWHWGINNHGAFPGGWGTQRWKDIIQYPSAYFAESILRVACQGGTAFLSEAAFGQNSIRGERCATYQYALIPLLNKIVNGDLPVPSRGQMLAQVRAVYTQADAFQVPYWTDHDTSNIIPSSGRYGIIPLIPRNVPTGDAARLGRVLTTAKDDRYFNSLYPSQTVSANDFTLRFQDTWFWMNSHENDYFLASSSFSLRRDPDITISVAATNHTFGTFREEDGMVHVHLNNYRLDLTDVYTDLAPDEDLPNPTQYIYDRMTVRRETSGNVITNADGGVLTAGGRVLNDQSRRDVRTTTITATGTRPTIQYAKQDPNHSRPYDHSETWDAATQTLILRITHNGPIDLSIVF